MQKACIITSTRIARNSWIVVIKTLTAVSVLALIPHINIVVSQEKGLQLCIYMYMHKGVSRKLVSLFLHVNICCVYSLEVPPWGTSNEYPQHKFLRKNKKNIHTYQWKKSILSGAMDCTTLWNTRKRPVCNLRTSLARISLRCLLPESMDTVVNKCMLTYRECSDQTALMFSLSWTFAVRVWHKGLFPMLQQQSLRSACTNVQSDLSFSGFCLFVLRFYSAVNPMGSCWARPVYRTTLLLGRFSPLNG